MWKFTQDITQDIHVLTQDIHVSVHYELTQDIHVEVHYELTQDIHVKYIMNSHRTYMCEYI